MINEKIIKIIRNKPITNDLIKSLFNWEINNQKVYYINLVCKKKGFTKMSDLILDIMLGANYGKE